MRNVNDLLESNIIDDSPAYHAFKNSKFSNSEIAHDFINMQLAQWIDREPIDIELIKIFKTLNKAGQSIAIERVEKLTVTIHGALHLAARHPASKIAVAGIRPLAVRRLFNGADALQFAAG